MSMYNMKIETNDESMMRDCLGRMREFKVLPFLGINWVIQSVHAKYGEQEFTIFLCVSTKES